MLEPKLLCSHYSEKAGNAICMNPTSEQAEEAIRYSIECVYFMSKQIKEWGTKNDYINT